MGFLKKPLSIRHIHRHVQADGTVKHAVIVWQGDTVALLYVHDITHAKVGG